MKNGLELSTDYQSSVDQDFDCSACDQRIRVGDYFSVDFEGDIRHQRIPGYAGDVLCCGGQYDPATGELIGPHDGWQAE